MWKLIIPREDITFDIVEGEAKFYVDDVPSININKENIDKS